MLAHELNSSMFDGNRSRIAQTSLRSTEVTPKYKKITEVRYGLDEHRVHLISGMKKIALFTFVALFAVSAYAQPYHHRRHHRHHHHYHHAVVVVR